MQTKEITIPTEWKDIKYKDYLRFVESIKGQEEDMKVVTEMALQYLCSLDVADYYALNTETFNDITATILKVLADQDKAPLVTSFTSGDIEYRINPNLDAMSYGEYLDLTTYSKDLWKNMPIICSILYRPLKLKIGSNYTIEPYSGTKDEKVQMFRELLTMDIVNGVIAFFLTLQKDLLKVSLTSSLKEVEKNLTSQQLETLLKSGVDIKQLQPLLEEISSNLIK